MNEVREVEEEVIEVVKEELETVEEEIEWAEKEVESVAGKIFDQFSSDQFGPELL